MTLRLNGSTSGYTEIDAPAVAGNNMVTLPAGSGQLQMMRLETAQASTSGTSVDFTGIPSWVKRVTIQLRGVSLSGTSSILVQLGSTTFATTGYTATTLGQNTSGVAAGLSSTSGVPLYVATAAATVSGFIRVETLGSNLWVIEGNAKFSTTEMCSCAGDVTLSGTLDRVRITTVNGTDTFDAGSINILYEG